MAPYNENGDNTFDRNDNEVLTLPVSMKYSEGSDFDTNEKYLFESPNTSDNTTYVIIQNGSNGRYYKIHLLNSEKKAYKIERNFNYGIIIKGFTGGSNSGAESLEDAKKSAPSNDLYAEILKESPKYIFLFQIVRLLFSFKSFNLFLIEFYSVFIIFKFKCTGQLLSQWIVYGK